MEAELARRLKKAKTSSLSVEEFKNKLMASIDSQMKTFGLLPTNPKPYKAESVTDIFNQLSSDSGKPPIFICRCSRNQKASYSCQ